MRGFVVCAVLVVATRAFAAPDPSLPDDIAQPVSMRYNALGVIYAVWRGPNGPAWMFAPPVGSPVDLLQLVCKVARDGKSAKCTTSPHDLDIGFEQRAKQCFQLTKRAATADELRDAQKLVTGSVVSLTKPPRLLLVHVTRPQLVDEYRRVGCESAHGIPCDPSMVRTGRKVWNEPAEIEKFGPIGNYFGVATPYAPHVVESHWVSINVATRAGGFRPDPRFEIPNAKTSRDWKAEYLARLEALDLTGADATLRGVVAYDRVALALDLHDQARLRPALDAYHALAAAGPVTSIVEYYANQVVPLAEKVLAGELVQDDPCAAPAATP